MTWHKIDFSQKSTLPQSNGNYLCRVVTPASHGRASVFYRTIYFERSYGFGCDNYIVTHWCDDFTEPEDV